MTIGCSFKRTGMPGVTGPSMRPGGIVLTRRALRICGLPPGSRIVDIGCGAGGTLRHLERIGGYCLVGLDYSETLLGETGPRLRGRVVRGRAETLPFKRDCFDALFCECVLSILGDKTTTLYEFARVLKKEGFLILSDVFCCNVRCQGRPEAESQGSETRGALMKEGVVGLLQRLGFSLLVWEEHGRRLRQFVARMIFAGERVPDLWGCREDREGKVTGRPQFSYFLLVARKTGPFFQRGKT